MLLSKKHLHKLFGGDESLIQKRKMGVMARFWEDKGLLVGIRSGYI